MKSPAYSLFLAYFAFGLGCIDDNQGICAVPTPINPEDHPTFSKGAAPAGNLLWLTAAAPLRLVEPSLELETVVVTSSVSAFRLPVEIPEGSYSAIAGDGQVLDVRVTESEFGLRPLTNDELEIDGMPRRVVDYCGERPMFIWRRTDGRYDPVLALIDVWGEDQDPLDDSAAPLVASTPLSTFRDALVDTILISAEGRAALTIRLRSVQDGRTGEPSSSSESTPRD